MKQGEVYWVKVNPTKGSEMRGKGAQGTRPCVILSPDPLNKNLQTVIVAPCTSTIRGYPFRVSIISLGKPGEVALDQMRTLDKSSKCFGSKMGKLTDKELKECLQVLQKVFSDNHI